MSTANAKKMILIAGCVAAGKSTFCHTLSKYLRIPCFQKDLVKETMADGMGPSAMEVENMALSLASGKLLIHMAQQCLAVEQPVILESNFRTTEAAELKEMLRRQGGSALTYMFTGDVQTLHKRFLQRDAARHPIHKSRDLRDFSVFQAGVRQLQDFSVGGETIRVDTTSFESVDWEELLLKGRQFLQSE